MLACAVVQILCPSCSNRLQLNGSFVLGRNGTACSTSHQNRALAHSKEHPECAHLCLLKWQSGVASATTLDAVGVGLGGLTVSSERLPIYRIDSRTRIRIEPATRTQGSYRRFLHLARPFNVGTYRINQGPEAISRPIHSIPRSLI